MGLFNNYSKPGPGVDKNAPKKKGIFRYFEIFGRKFSPLIRLNMEYVLFSVPAILICFFLAAPLAYSYVSSLMLADAEMVNISSAGFSLFFTVFTVIMIGSGPASAAMAYIMRCFCREQHAWLWSDFKEKTKENFKQGILAFVFDLIILYVGVSAAGIYLQLFSNSGKMMWFLLMWIVILMLIIFSYAHIFLYQLMITFENKFFALYKNALLLAAASLPMCILISLIALIVCFLVFLSFNPVISVLFTVIFLIAFLRFPAEFYAESVIRRRILDNMDASGKDREE